MIRKIKDRARIDERYEIVLFEDGNLEVLRNGERWLENPVGSKAWIAALYKIKGDK